MGLLACVLALGPVAIYVMAIGWLLVRGRPTVIGGTRDTLSLALAMVGLIAIGPAELFFPQAAFHVLGPWVWVVMGLLYLFIVTYILLHRRPRIVVYGVTAEQLAGHVDALLQSIDAEPRWLGMTVESAKLGIQASIEPAGMGQVSHLVASRRAQQVESWIVLSRELARRLQSVPVPRDMAGWGWAAAGAALLVGLIISVWTNPDAISHGWHLLARRTPE